MSQVRAFSSPELAATSSTTQTDRPEDLSLEGIATNVKLLLKLIQDHAEASTRDLDDRKIQRVAGMMTILDDVKARIQKSQSLKNRKAELRRCNTDLRPNRGVSAAPRDKKQADQPSVTDEKEKLRRQLYASLAARKSLEIMCSSLGKEKEIIASELARKVQELNGTEELINDLKAQNETLLGKLQHCASEHKEKRPSCSGREIIQGNAALQERNKALSEQLLKSLDGYRSLKRKYKDAQQENVSIRSTMEEMRQEVEAGLEQINGFRQRIATREEQLDIEAEVSALEHMFESFKLKISNHMHKKRDCSKLKAHINACKPSLLA
ncbi:hypothetical protein Dsin_020855 [Dipteronia sinensis]|uniref:Uncharacterized protein n=1 Tax=Dipteronia sinensis TaxID=43782 RepID=A0AAE0AAT4_9ROSI|nr:hypothetical protein Dsin_020855 [Dipteronia sinensis]